MTDELHKLSREIVAANPYAASDGCFKTPRDFVKLGLEAGMKLQRERDAVMVELTLLDESGDDLAKAIRNQT